VSRAARRHERARDVRATYGAARTREKKPPKKKERFARFFLVAPTGRKETPDSAKKGKALSSCQLSLVGIQVGSCLGRKRRPTCAWRVAQCEKLTDRRKATRAARAVRAAGASGRTRELGHVVAGHLLEPPSLRSSGCGAVGRRVSTGRSLGLVGRTHMAHERFDRRARAREPRSGYGAREAVPARAYETCDLPGEVPFA
jgi:hypothetical protein